VRIRIRSNSRFSKDLIRFFSNRLGGLPEVEAQQPVSLSISDVRKEILTSIGSPEVVRADAPVDALIARVFQEVFAGVLGDDTSLQWQAVLLPETLSDRRKFVEHVYDKLLGPRLTAHQAALQEAGPQVLDLWKASQELCEWVVKLMESSARERIIDFDRVTQRWLYQQPISVVEHPLSWLLRSPGWTRPVHITGSSEGLWRNPHTGHWCVVEFKAGRTSLLADAAQASLYYELLSRSGLITSAFGAVMSTVAFLPEREERFFDGPQLAAVLPELKALIGRFAGVLPGQVKGPKEDVTPAPEPQEPPEQPGQKLLQTLAQFGLITECRGSPQTGMAFLRYAVMPRPGVKLPTIINRAEDLQGPLGLDSVPLIQKADGQLIIDIARADRETVSFSSIQPQLPRVGDSEIRLLLGIDINGQAQFADLSHTPHVLVAGSVGSGKTEWMRTALASLVSRYTPQTLRLVLIDPKQDAFQELKGSPFLFDPDAWAQSALDVWDLLVAEMEKRSGDSEAGTATVRPRIVCFCDAYDDLVSIRSDRKEIEERIRRLGSHGRAAGIHLVIASGFCAVPDGDDVLTANLPGRVCLRTSDQAQSNTILGQSGAERLLGKGDLLWMDTGEPVRLASPLLSSADRARIFQSPAGAALRAGG
jgi:S-DNA-T family DNA segregation ATPase FtsK/SpoIIIE